MPPPFVFGACVACVPFLRPLLPSRILHCPALFHFLPLRFFTRSCSVSVLPDRAQPPVFPLTRPYFLPAFLFAHACTSSLTPSPSFGFPDTAILSLHGQGTLLLLCSSLSPLPTAQFCSSLFRCSLLLHALFLNATRSFSPVVHRSFLSPLFFGLGCMVRDAPCTVFLWISIAPRLFFLFCVCHCFFISSASRCFFLCWVFRCFLSPIPHIFHSSFAAYRYFSTPSSTSGCGSVCLPTSSCVLFFS
jgi:hypothetical protein